jgi:hypothetical protein
MFRYTNNAYYFQLMTKLRRPSRIGYEITQLPDPRAVRDFVAQNQKKIVVAVLSEYPDCETTNRFLGTLHETPLGSPSDVVLATMPFCAKYPDFVNHFNVVAFPTTLLFLDNKVQERVTGGRSKELSVKSRLLARREGLDCFSDGA